MYNPSLEYAPDMVNFAYDFNGDGWPDIVASDIEGGLRPLDLFINPAGESRRWTKYRAISNVSTELVLMKDIDGDGKLEILFGGGGVYSYAKPDPENISGLWKITPISGKLDRINNHGMGVGDINGDGRKDFVVPTGWYEQPSAGVEGKPWVFHEVDFGGGGGEMGIYDVNGDGLNDVVTSLEAHGFGLAWFEQKRSANGAITFVRHDIAGDFTSNNAGGVTFSQPHATAFADMDGDGIPDMVVGKSMWHHLESWGEPVPYGTPVLYVYRTVRDPRAPGGAVFVPVLVNNHSGVGSAIQVTDLNHDGAQDILTQSSLGTFVFYGHPGKWPKAVVKVPATAAAKGR
ncbi:MAG: VCBS repeat-containing protein [Granulicella sp.]